MRIRPTKVVDAHGRPFYVASSRPRTPFEGGGTGRRWAGIYSGTHSLNSALLASHRLLVDRSRTLIRNHPSLGPALKKRVANVVGCRVRPQHFGRTEEERTAIAKAWDWWDLSCECDAYGRTTFTGLLRLMTWLSLGDGEAFGRIRYRLPEDGLLVPMQLQALTTDSVDATMNEDRGSAIIRAGIEFDLLDRRVAYHVKRRNPIDAFTFRAATSQTSRVDAREMVHLHELEDAGQVRGVPVLARGLLRAHDVDVYDDAQLKRQQMASQTAGFIKTSAGGADLVEDIGEEQGKDTDEPLEWEAGALLRLEDNEEITFPDLPSMGADYDAAMRRYDRQLAEAIGVAPWMLDGLLEKINFTSSRVELMDWRRLWRIEVAQQLIPQVCMPVYAAWLDHAVGTRAVPIDLADYQENRRDFLMIPWRTEGYEWVDPQKESTAAEKQIQSGQTTQTWVLAARGYDLDEYVETRRTELERARAAGIDLTSHVTPAETAAPAKVPPPGPGSEEPAPADEPPADNEGEDNADAA